jgi:cation transport ATPase
MKTDIRKRVGWLIAEVAIGIALVLGVIYAAAHPEMKLPSRNWVAFAGCTLIVFLGGMPKFVLDSHQRLLVGRLKFGAFIAHMALGTFLCVRANGNLPVLLFFVIAIVESVLIFRAIARIANRGA